MSVEIMTSTEYQELDPIDVVQPLEFAFNILTDARCNAMRNEQGLVTGYDDLVGRVGKAKITLQNSSLNFPEMEHRIREAEIFLGIDIN